MALKKTYASYMKREVSDVTLPDGTVAQQTHEELVPQRDVDMHPLEEEATQKGWAMHEEMAKVPLKPTIEQEHEWLLEHGVDHIKQKRVEWQAVSDAAQPAIQQKHDDYQAAMAKWNGHAEKSVASGRDPDINPEGNY